VADQLHMQKKPASSKQSLHSRNQHNGNYDLAALTTATPELGQYVFENQFGTQTINFAEPLAVKALNKALLYHHYGIQHWDIPAGYLCPPIPGRADYIHYIADILAENNKGVFPKGNTIKCLDIGTGANCIYPIIGHQEYGWNFVGADIDPVSVKSAKTIVVANETLTNNIEIRHQTDKGRFFKGIIKSGEKFDITMCNPPFHASQQEAQAQNMRKVKNLTGKTNQKPSLNFGGKNNELWYEGGEYIFVKAMIEESQEFAGSVKWFTSLVSKKENLPAFQKLLKYLKATDVKILEMTQGQKISRLIAWRF
jgi:23S rRNA (adenine1618-N6)-methyltransferase